MVAYEHVLRREGLHDDGRIAAARQWHNYSHLASQASDLNVSTTLWRLSRETVSNWRQVVAAMYEGWPSLENFSFSSQEKEEQS